MGAATGQAYRFLKGLRRGFPVPSAERGDSQGVQMQPIVWGRARLLSGRERAPWTGSNQGSPGTLINDQARLLFAWASSGSSINARRQLFIVSRRVLWSNPAGLRMSCAANACRRGSKLGLRQPSGERSDIVVELPAQGIGFGRLALGIEQPGQDMDGVHQVR